VSPVQVVRQAVPEAHFRCPSQLRGALSLQTDAPLHDPGGVSVLPEQVAEPQAVPTLSTRQAPPPVQVPSVPHSLTLSTAHSLSGSSCSGMATQRPDSLSVLALLQATQVPVHALSQQTPSTQWSERHSPPSLHSTPSTFLFAQTWSAQ
jgi:hypothetical protein